METNPPFFCTNIIQNIIFFGVLLKKETHTGLGHEGQLFRQNFHFWEDYPFKINKILRNSNPIWYILMCTQWCAMTLCSFRLKIYTFFFFVDSDCGICSKQKIQAPQKVCILAVSSNNTSSRVALAVSRGKINSVSLSVFFFFV